MFARVPHNKPFLPNILPKEKNAKEWHIWQELTCCLARVFNFKLGCFDYKAQWMHVMYTNTSTAEILDQVLSCWAKIALA
jgi:hypothetical protein